ncbi:sensor histidine kinase [Paenibacillus sp. CAU 1782]
MKLGSKIHLYSSVLFAVLLLAANVTVYTVFSKMMMNREMNQLQAETEQAAEALRAASGSIAINELLRAYVPLDGMLGWVKNGDGTGAAVTSGSQTELSRQAEVFYDERRREQIDIGGNRYGFVSIPVIATDGAVANVQATSSLEELMELLHILRLVLISVSAAVLVPVVISSGVLGRLLMRPIAEMTGTMRRIIRSGEFVQLQNKGKSRDELAAMGETFNEMIALLEDSFARQEQFVSNASHELKTPLTIIESYASLLKRRGGERPELLQECIEAIHSEAVRMKGMTEQLLLLATSRREWKADMEVLELLPFARQAADLFSNVYGRDVVVKATGDERCEGIADRDMLKQVLFILLDNARKYSEGPITLEVGELQGGSYLSVRDNGIGIPAEELPNVFQRFYRVDKARGRDGGQEGGAGLGLSLGKELSDAFGARLELESVFGVGTTATITLAQDGELTGWDEGRED